MSNRKRNDITGRQPTRTHKTEKQYQMRAAALVKEYESVCGCKFGEDPLKFVAWVEEELPKRWVASTWRVLRQCLRKYLEENGPQESIFALELIDSRRCKNKALAETSARKEKGLPDDEFSTLLNRLRFGKPRGKWDLFLADWLKVSALTGLRPQEWENAWIVTHADLKTLVVKNAKNTNFRSHGETRGLDISKFPEDEQQSIIDFLESFKLNLKRAGSYDQLHAACRNRLLRVNQMLWPERERNITLYSARHEFRRRAKANNFSGVEIAALMGHKTERTNEMHYGRPARNKGGSGNTPQPRESDVARVKKSEKCFKSRPVSEPDLKHHKE